MNESVAAKLATRAGAVALVQNVTAEEISVIASYLSVQK